MVDVWLPYGKTEVCLRVPTRNFLGTVEPKEKLAVSDARVEIERALKEPVGSKRLAEIVKPDHKVAIVVDDATRPAPSHLMIPPILEELNNAGVRDENVTIIFGCGVHRAVTREEAVRLIGDAVVNRVKTISHDCRASDLVYVGTTKFGTKVYLNHVFAEADVKILTGDVSFHYYAGYGGGRKSVLPGVAGEETIKANHAMLLHPKARTGVLDGNPVHEDMVEAAKMAKVDFILNVVVNSKGEIVKAFAGDLEQAFLEGVKLVDEMYRVPVDRRADIVVVSPGGYPADVNLYQAYKAIDSALEIVKRNGVIILVAECPEGHGNQAFFDWMAKFKDLKIMEKEIKRNFVLGGHKAYLLMKALQKAQIILVSVMPDYYTVNVFKLKTARTVNEALGQAFKIAEENAKVWVIPYGNYTLPEVKASE
ncbi:MAG: nickel-dependent lactate racemase [Candidatus Bathyarchaeia archaeon]|nr:nickel-dependent lactate racemase [Candidatus Bathyarchaeota archaeon]